MFGLLSLQKDLFRRGSAPGCNGQQQATQQPTELHKKFDVCLFPSVYKQLTITAD
jgi:hypothetical protein